MTAPSLLVVDDDPLAARYMTLALSEAFGEVRTASDGLAALRAAESRPPDVVLTDLRMPGMDGLELLAHLRQRWPEVPVLLVTVEQDIAIVVEAMERGALNYLVKPVSPAVLLTAVRKALSRGASPPRRHDAVPELVGQSEVMVRIRHRVALAARGDANVLITGETGTGKELVARAIHRLSKAVDGPFVPHNCAVTPPELFESQFFGHCRGAFTGADRDGPGLFEEADGGVLFLDELECLSLPHQSKLLRVLDDGVVRRVGSATARAVSVRLLSATNRSPEAMLRDGTLRDDLYYRLRGFEVRLPPLRDRRSDVAELAAHFLAGTGAGLTPDAVATLEAHPWPGNVRQLRSVVLAAAQVVAGGVISRRHLDLPGATTDAVSRGSSSGPCDLRQLERDAIARALSSSNGNRTLAARALGIHRSTLRRKMEDLGLSTPFDRAESG